MHPVGQSSQIQVLLPVGQIGSARVAALLLDHLSYELRSRHVDDVERAEPGAPDGPVQPPLYILEDLDCISTATVTSFFTFQVKCTTKTFNQFSYIQ